MHIGTKVAYNTIVQVISKIVTTALGLLAVAIMARYLGVNGFGEYTTIITFLAFFGIMADLGLNLVAVQMISMPGANEKKIVDNLFSLRFFTALLFLGVAPLAAMFFPYGSDIKIGISIATISFFFTALNQIFVAIFQKNLRLDRVSIAETAGRVLLLAGTYLSASNDWGLQGMMFSVVAGSVVQFLLLYVYSLKYVRPSFGFDFSLWKDIMSKSWPLALTIFFNLLYLKTDTLILSLIKTTGEVGIYGAAYKVIDILSTLPFIFAGVVLPILTYDWGKGVRDRFEKVLQKSFDLMIVLAVPIIVGTQFLAKPIMIMVAGKEFAESGAVLQILIIAVSFVFVSSFLGHVIVAIGAQRKIIWAYFFTAVTSVIGYFVFIPKYSLFGAAAITVYSEVVITVFMLYYTIRLVKYVPKFQIFGKAVLAAAVMGLVLKLVPQNFYSSFGGLSITVVSVSLVYFVALYLFKGISNNDVSLLLNQESEEKKYL